MNTESIEKLIGSINSAWPSNRWLNYRVIVAVSGGADSVALLRALVQIRDSLVSVEPAAGSLMVAHFNHRLRGDESDGDAEFVKELAAAHQLPFHGEEASDASGSGSENELRDQRYRFLQDLARLTNSRYIVTAHHQDDQVETVLFRLFRGTGLRGLRGIPMSRVIDNSITLVRPMLEVDRETIEQAMAQWEQPWRSDATNRESFYARNFIRNEILPTVRERFGAMDRAVARLAKQAHEHGTFVEGLVEPLWSAVGLEGNSVTLDCGPLSQQPQVLLRELIVQIYRRKEWPTDQLGYDDIERVAGIIVKEGDVPTFQLPGGVDTRKLKDEIRLIRS